MPTMSIFDRIEFVERLPSNLASIARTYADADHEDCYVDPQRSSKQNSRQLCIQRDVKALLDARLKLLGSNLPQFQQRRLIAAIAKSVAGDASLYDDTNIGWHNDATKAAARQHNNDRIIHASSWVWPTLISVLFSVPEGLSDRHLD